MSAGIGQEFARAGLWRLRPTVDVRRAVRYREHLDWTALKGDRNDLVEAGERSARTVVESRGRGRRAVVGWPNR